MVLSLGFVSVQFFLLILSSSAPQFIHLSLKLKDTAPHLLQVLIFDLKELKPRNTINNKKRGIKNKSSKIFPIKLIKKLIPKIGIPISSIKEKISNFLFTLRKLFM